MSTEPKKEKGYFYWMTPDGSMLNIGNMSHADYLRYKPRMFDIIVISTNDIYKEALSNGAIRVTVYYTAKVAYIDLDKRVLNQHKFKNNIRRFAEDLGQGYTVNIFDHYTGVQLYGGTAEDLLNNRLLESVTFEQFVKEGFYSSSDMERLEQEITRAIQVYHPRHEPQVSGGWLYLIAHQRPDYIKRLIPTDYGVRLAAMYKKALKDQQQTSMPFLEKKVTCDWWTAH